MPTRSVPLSPIGMEASVGPDDRGVLRPSLWWSLHLQRFNLLGEEGWKGEGADGCAPDLADLFEA